MNTIRTPDQPISIETASNRSDEKADHDANDGVGKALRGKPLKVDLIVLGQDAEGAAAAANVARCGLSVCLLPTGAEIASSTYPDLPNRLWRDLDLVGGAHSSVAYGACASSADGDQWVRTHLDQDDMRSTLEAEISVSPDIWTAFQSDIADLFERVEALSIAATNLHGGDGALHLGIDPMASANSVLDGYFAHEEFKAHLLCRSVLAFGLSGDEPGSARALAALDPRAWPHRHGEGALSLHDGLLEACDLSGVTRINVRVTEIAEQRNGTKTVSLENGDEVQARSIIVSSLSHVHPDAAYFAVSDSPLRRFGGAQARVALAFGSSESFPETLEDQVNYIVGTREDFRVSREAMREGRINDAMPLKVERDGNRLIVTAPYCPAMLEEEGEMREWSGQDRQAFGRQVFDRLRRVFSLEVMPTKIDVALSLVPQGSGQAQDEGALTKGAALVSAPLPSVVPVSTCADFALRLVQPGRSGT
ncbi:MAG: hypothetical protein AAFR21_02675 [Pseudomonadota bacterium]